MKNATTAIPFPAMVVPAFARRKAQAELAAELAERPALVVDPKVAQAELAEAPMVPAVEREAVIRAADVVSLANPIPPRLGASWVSWDWPWRVCVVAADPVFLGPLRVFARSA